MNDSTSHLVDTPLQLTFDESRAAWRISGGQAIMIHTETSAYYSLSSIATYVFVALFAKSTSLRDTTELLSSHFHCSAEDVARDISHFLNEMYAEGLLARETATSGQVSSEPAPDITLPATYEKPVLTRHGQLDTLILSSE